MLVNGEPNQHISIFDRGLAYGDGFFETIYCCNEAMQNWLYHWQRMRESAERLNILLPDESTFLVDLEKIKSTFSTPRFEWVIKIVVTRGVGGRGYSPNKCETPTRIMYVGDMPPYEALRRRGMRVSLLKYELQTEPMTAGLKHLNRLPQVLAKTELDGTGCDEGIVLNSKGFVREGVSSNIFMIKNDRLLTAPLYDCGVAGVLRRKLIDVSSDICGLSVEQVDFTFGDIMSAEEVFFANSLLGVCPVKEIGNTPFKIGETTRRLMEACLQADTSQVNESKIKEISG
ncbi:aminodeoxychorismate lyase [Rhodobacteraceae bacterium KLH11]|nr:aminodeoxychorismate lyase [Rhodobacteraceae bacterium KLH11]